MNPSDPTTGGEPPEFQGRAGEAADGKGGGPELRTVLVVAAVALLIAFLVIAAIVARNAFRGFDPAGPGEGADLEAPYEPVFDDVALEAVLRPVREQIDAGAFPGAAVAVGIRDQEAHLSGLGEIGWTRNAAAVDPDSTIYDLASITKVMAAASAVLLLVDEGRIGLDDPASLYLPGFDEPPKDAITLRHMLTHSSGLPAGAIFRGDDRADRIARATGFSIYPPAGARQEYSDVGFVLLWEAAERAAGAPLTEYLERRLYLPLGMTSTGYDFGLDCERCAPTGRLRDQSLFRGRPFDPIAQRLDGISGNSGLFSTASDMARFAAMVTSGGVLDGVRVLEESTAREFITQQPYGNRFWLGWQLFCPRGGDDEDDDDGCTDPMAIGHNGWTGTSLRIDLRTGLWVVLLTNRTYEPRAPNRIQAVRRATFEAARRVVAASVPSSAGPDESPAP